MQVYVVIQTNYPDYEPPEATILEVHTCKQNAEMRVKELKACLFTNVIFSIEPHEVV